MTNFLHVWFFLLHRQDLIENVDKFNQHQVDAGDLVIWKLRHR